jgi:hypothetical protein
MIGVAWWGVYEINDRVYKVRITIIHVFFMTILRSLFIVSATLSIAPRFERHCRLQGDNILRVACSASWLAPPVLLSFLERAAPQ